MMKRTWSGQPRQQREEPLKTTINAWLRACCPAILMAGADDAIATAPQT
jgi:hypothetical protein